MKKSYAIHHVVCTRFLLILLFFFTNRLNGQNLQGVYVWDFQMADGKENSLTKDISDVYQSILTNSWGNIRVLERRQLASILAHRNNEITFLNGNFTIPQEVVKTLTDYGANVVVLGEIKQNQGQGIYTVNVKFVNIFNTQILSNPLESFPESDFDSKTTRDKLLKSLVPDAGVIPKFSKNQDNGTQDATIDRMKLEIESEVWKYAQQAYFEDFSNWRSRDGFRNDIWNKREDNQQKSGIYDNRYLVHILRNGFTKHKYIEDESIGANNDFTLAHPVSISVYIPDSLPCRSTDNCLGRGLSVRFDKEKNSGYALTLTDDGELKFFRFNNIHEPENIVPLFSSKVDIKKKKSYDLGVVSLNNQFYLYFERNFVRMVTDSTFKTGIDGVFASGKGLHWFDNITVYKAIRVK